LTVSVTGPVIVVLLERCSTVQVVRG